MEIAPTNIQSLKFPIGTTTKVESNPIEVVKNLVAQKKKGGMKLYRKKKENVKHKKI